MASVQPRRQVATAPATTVESRYCGGNTTLQMSLVTMQGANHGSKHDVHGLQQGAQSVAALVETLVIEQVLS